MLDPLELADVLAGGGLDPQPDELVVVELLGVLGALARIDWRTVSSVPRAASAAVRSAISSNRTTSRPEWVRAPATRERAAPRCPSLLPAAKRRSGSSVRGSTKTSPRSPWARPIRPTTT